MSSIRPCVAFATTVATLVPRTGSRDVSGCPLFRCPFLSSAVCQVVLIEALLGAGCAV